jgi:hypothetical protein
MLSFPSFFAIMCILYIHREQKIVKDNQKTEFLTVTQGQYLIPH